VAGGSLLQRFQLAPLPLPDLVDIAARLAATVHALHLEQVAHLDLKPAKMLQRPSG